MKEGKIVLGVLAGLAAGAVLGILLAPDKGSNTRKKIYGQGSKYAEELKDKISELYESVVDNTEKSKDALADISSNAKTEAEKLRKAVHQATS